MRATWLREILEDAGLTVICLPGWETRGGPLASIDAVIEHATITPKTTSDENVARLLRDGHSTLPGPLSQCGLDRQGRWWVVAAGRCNHNGYGAYGNDTIGVEWFLAAGEAPTAAQIASAQRGTAAIVRQARLNVLRVLAHRESDPGRKTDPAGVDMAAFRAAVAHHLNPTQQEDLLMAAALNDDDARRALVRQWFWTYLGRGPKTADEQNLHVYVFATKGADVCLAGIVDSTEAQAYRKLRATA